MIDELLLARISGQTAVALLAATLLAGLHQKTRPQRRKLGLATFIAAAAHALYTTTSPLVEDLSHLFYEPQLRAGATTLFILLVLAATSFPQRFKIREWKTFHRLSYGAAFLAIHHIALASHATKLALLAPLTALTVALALRTGRLLQNFAPKPAK